MKNDCTIVFGIVYMILHLNIPAQPNLGPPQSMLMYNSFFYSDPNPVQLFLGYPKGKDKITFESYFHHGTGDSVYIIIDKGQDFAFHTADSLKKYPKDFDSLFVLETKCAPNQEHKKIANDASSYMRTGESATECKMDTIQHRAIVHGQKWIFKVVDGKISLFNPNPLILRDYSFMQIDNGDLECYDKEFVIKKLATNMESKRLLNAEIIGNVGSVALEIAGVGIGLYGLFHMSHEVSDGNGGVKNELKFNYALPIGPLVYFSGISYYFLIKNNYYKSIIKYNELVH